MAEENRFDVVIVGAGPAGAAAALVLARAGLQVLVFERGEFPGSKNLFGGILYSTIVHRLLPGFWESAPVERHVTRRKFSMLGQEKELAFEFNCPAFNQPPYNHSFTVLRSQFDRWFAAQAEAAGAMLFNETVVDSLIFREGRVDGAIGRREDGEVHADVTLVAEGCNSMLALRHGFRKEFEPHRLQLAVKEMIGLPREVIDDRFQLVGDEGAAIEYLGGDAVQGLFGGAFIYTEKESLSVGVSCSLHDLAARKVTPHEVLEHFKKHPCVQPLLRGGEILEYSGHMIPEFGRETLPRIAGDGVLFLGDSAGLVNLSPFYHEGTNLAMASGVLAAETVLALKRAGKPMTAENLSAYTRRLAESFVLKDVSKYRRIPDFGVTHPQFFDRYPYLLTDLAKDFFTVSETPKGEIEKAIFRRLREEVGLFRLVRDLFAAARALR
ncbi:MAG: FAD-dependent oxidoreductase [Planctomycetes bacterium]|nr:FAD-dependent oxidoreductase [Planctomycetota bacterium]